MSWKDAVRAALEASDVAGAYEVAIEQAIADLDLQHEGVPRTDDLAIAAFMKRAAELLHECGVIVRRDSIEWWEATP